MSKSKSDDSTCSDKMVSKMKVRYAKDFGKNSSGALLCQLSKPLDNMISGDEIPCGSERRYPKHIQKELLSICFNCNLKFGSLEAKILHVRKKHQSGKGSKLCPTCFSATKTPTAHVIKVTGNVSDVVGDNSGDLGETKDNVADSVAGPS